MNISPHTPSCYQSIHHLFEEYSSLTPDNIAIKFKSADITYAELNARANYLASYLKRKHVKREDIVALEMSHTPEFVVAILAILKCGAAYLPIDTQLPSVRIQQYIDIAKVNVVIGYSKRLCHQYTVENFVDFDDVSLFENRLESFQSCPCESDSRAYVMFTSGSTGEPKGVEVPHRAVIRLVKRTNYINILETDCILQFAPANFDASTFEVWGALLNGATVALYSGEGLDPNLLRKELTEHNVTILWLTAALFHLVADKFSEIFQPLRTLLAGGDVLSAKYIKKVINQFPELVVINGYGPTENTTFTCCHRITKDNLPEANVPIGSAITGTKVYVLDDELNPVTPGQVGELYTSGEGVALGYINSNIGNDSFFYNEKIAEGLIYRTGDLVAKNPKGEIEFHGRKDNQVKIRGYRVSLEEVKTAILKIEDVVDAIVTTKKYESGDRILIAYIQLKDQQAYTPKTIKQILKNTLPNYMIPDSYIFSETLPINNNGKVDRKLVSTI